MSIYTRMLSEALDLHHVECWLRSTSTPCPTARALADLLLDELLLLGA